MAIIKGIYSVYVGGTDVSGRFAPFLNDLTVDRSGGNDAADSLSIRLADQDGRVFMPSERAPIQVFLNGKWAFEGFVTEVGSRGSKGTGRELSISGSSIDPGGKVKEPDLKHKDDASFSDVASEFGSRAGLSVQTIGSIASIEREYWLLQSESFQAWGQRIAREIGATFKVVGSRAFFAARNEGLSVSGQPLTPIIATEGVNLLSWDVRPTIGRPRFSDVEISYFDRDKGERVTEKIESGITDVRAVLRSQMLSATEGQAKSKAESLGKESDREKGGGSITIIGDAAAEPEAICTLVGARPGIDGSYRIESVSHSVSKSAGFTTTLNLKQPSEGAGQDTRTAGAAGGLNPADQAAVESGQL